jgi:hypothetical protein
MIMNLKRYTIAFLALLAGVSTWAQNMDPTVTVTRQYQGKLIEVGKPDLTMTVPDSLTRFDLKIDYSVFDNPYKGAYEFNPYLMEIRPQSEAFYGNEFFLRAGAGYALYPTLDLAWTPKTKKTFKMSIFASHDSYFGHYRTITAQKQATTAQGSNPYILTYKKGDAKWKGYDMLSRAGVNIRSDWKKGIFAATAMYYGIHTRDNILANNDSLQRGYNAADVNLRLTSKKEHRTQFFYDVAMGYRFAAETPAGAFYHNLALDLTMGKNFNSKSAFYVDLRGDSEISDTAFSSVSTVSLVPKYVYNYGRWNIEAGLNLSLPYQTIDNKFGQIAYPAIDLNFEMVKKYLNVYLEAKGGTEVASYASMLQGNHHFSSLYSFANSSITGISMERVGAKFGFEGNFAQRFFYDLSAGYNNYLSLPVYTVFGLAGTQSVMTPGIVYSAAAGLRADAKMGWKSERVDVEAYFAFSNLKVEAPAFAPSQFKAGVDAKYNWNKRIYAGVFCDYASASKYSDFAILPYYVDLGLMGEYKLNRKFSLWLEAGNLMNMTIQKTPLYAESGINFTVGICLNF